MKANDTCKVNVMMFGGRRCGKTSVIAAMQKCIEERFRGESSLVMTYGNETLDVIKKKEREIRNFLKGTEKTFVPDEGATKEENEYKFDISLKGKNGTISLSFYDYPGEWLNRSDKEELLKERVGASNIFMIAIDTPMLMEEPDFTHEDKIGRFNDETNKSYLVCNTIKSVLKDRGNSEMPPLVMFVPLKCEKYHNENRMNEVNKKVHAAYRPLFDFFGGDNESNYEVVIAPILTLGEKTAQFSRFEYNEDGTIDEIDGRPKASIYIRLSPQPVYSPLYCEQPLLYALEYLLYMARKQKEDKIKKRSKLLPNLWFMFGFMFYDWIMKLPNIEDFLEQENYIRPKIRREEDGDGYEIVYNPMKL